METSRWIPIAQYSVEEGVSISTIRRKIKSNALEHKMDGGRYLIKSDRANEEASEDAANAIGAKAGVFPVASSDAAPKSFDVLREVQSVSGAIAQRVAEKAPISSAEYKELDLKLKALDARLNGLAKKLDYVLEQNSELNMLVKVFEEKLNATI